MKVKKAKTAVIAIAVATAIALSGTFAWQSISQTAQNEATKIANPGGRLHDDFSGYGPEDTKDIYVENFGNEPIYARVRLDEYMEIGSGAGLKEIDDGSGTMIPNPKNHAVSLVPGADINDVDTWTTHIPGDSYALVGEGKETGFADPGKTFHTYWTWTMGGHATDNPDGKTIYMPTFNKNKDSLRADINGTLAGLDKDPATGDPYDDYHPYAVGDTADRVRDPDTTTYPKGSTYDIDDDTTDECGPYGGVGGTGVEGVNYGMKEETHKAQETMNASVITMAEYKTKSDADKEAFVGWVYDVDGWAYWSQPIPPGTPTDTDKFVTNATGVLLDRIVLEHEPSDAWYYSINAVGQFITADDLGRTDTPATGFYDDDAEKPTEDALDLLEGIGVNTASVKGAVTPAASVTVDGTVHHLTYAVQNMNIDLSAAVTVAGITSPDQTVTWTVSGNTDATTTIDTSSGSPVLKVGSAETGTLKVVAASTTYDRLKGKLVLPVQPLTYTVTVTPVGDATSVLPGTTLGFTAKFTSNDFRTGLPQTFDWNLNSAVSHKLETDIKEDSTDSSKATLAVAGNEDGTVSFIVTPKDSGRYPGVSTTVTIPVTAVTFTSAGIKSDSGVLVTGKTVEVRVGVANATTFAATATSTPSGAAPTKNWTWTSSDTTGKITVDNTGKVTIASDTALGTTATITATNSDYTPALTASFTVKAKDRWETMTVDGIEFYVLKKDATITGTDGNTHTASLLLSKDILGEMAHNPSTSPYKPMWKDSEIREYLNSDAASYTGRTFDGGTNGWLAAHPTIKAKAVEVKIETRKAFDTAITDGGVNNKVFLLSEADVFGTSNYGADTPKPFEYTFGGKLDCFEDNASRIALNGGTADWWWLRSPACSSISVAGVVTDGTVGSFVANYTAGGVRPAFWLGS